MGPCGRPRPCARWARAYACCLVPCSATATYPTTKLAFCAHKQAKILRAAGEGLRLPLAGGAAQRLVDDTRNGLAAGVLDAPPASEELTDAALFIDQSAQQLGPVAATKWGGWG